MLQPSIEFPASNDYLRVGEYGGIMKFFIPDYVMRWLGPTLILAIGVWVIFDLPVGRATLCEPEKNCLISWIGALSGWVAAVAAFFTIRAMLALQRENVDIQLHPKVTLARLVRRRCNADKKRLSRLADLKLLTGDQAVKLTAEQAKDVKRLKRSFDQVDFDDFERVEFVGATYLRSVRAALGAVVVKLNLYKGDSKGAVGKNVLWPGDFALMAEALRRAEEHNARLSKASRRFLKRWRNRGISF